MSLELRSLVRGEEFTIDKWLFHRSLRLWTPIRSLQNGIGIEHSLSESVGHYPVWHLELDDRD